jgi:starvation-inducible DNA-binding protein
MLVDDLKMLLGTTFAVYVKAHGFHFNVEGSDFYQYHKFLGEYYQDLYDTVDVVGEHIRALDSYTPGALSRMLELSKVPEQTEVIEAKAMLVELLRDNLILTEIVKHCFKMAEAEDKQGLVDYLGQRIAAHDKWSWMIRSLLK